VTGAYVEFVSAGRRHASRRRFTEHNPASDCGQHALSDHAGDTTHGTTSSAVYQLNLVKLSLVSVMQTAATRGL